MLDPLPIAEFLYALVLYQLIQWWQHRPPSHGSLPPLRPTKAQRPPPLPDLIEKPHCEARAEAAQRGTPLSPTPPPMRHRHTGCPRRIDTTGQYCPNKKCCYYS